MGQALLDYICNLIAGSCTINQLYNAVERAREVRGFSNGQFCYRVFLPGIGCKTFKRGELLKLDDRALCTTIEQVAAEIEGCVPTVKQAVLLLLIARPSIKKFFEARFKACYLRSTVRKFCVTFYNPFFSISGVKQRCIQFKGPELGPLFCECSKRNFDPLQLWAGLCSNKPSELSSINLEILGFRDDNNDEDQL